MAEPKDSLIKLFGQTIPIPEDPPPVPSAAAADVADDDFEQDRVSLPEDDANGDGVEDVDVDVDDMDMLGVDKQINNKQEDGELPVISEESNNPEGTSKINENRTTPSVGKESVPLKAANTEGEESETSTSQDKTLKKPDKIIPCPRCNSMDTKFCYYNNYNVNQPRHFCKNCQRYWTAGGTMRNVPVGAGRRKNKNSASHYHHITVPNALQTARFDVPNVVHHPALKTNGTVLTFGSDTPLCESMASVLSLAEKTMHNCTQNGFHKPEERNIPVSYRGRENGDEGQSGSSAASSTSMDEAGRNGSREPMMHNFPGCPPQMPGFSGGPWPYPWNPAHWSSPVPPPAFFPPGFPMPFYPTATYWGCTVPGPWNVPWLPQLPPSPNQSSQSSSPISPTLGKHSRDENMFKTSPGEGEPLKEKNSERSLWIPKTLRIDDPSEAAKSSLLATLGINNDKADSIRGGSLFKAFQSKSDKKNYVPKTSLALQANPAALSRSLNFQESS